MRLNLAINTVLVLAIGAGLFSQTTANAQSNSLAPGVLHVIPSLPQARDTYTNPMPLPGLNATEWQPNFASKKHTLYGQTNSIVLFRDVWQYEIAILGLRQIRLEVTKDDGTKTGKNVWYLVYRIRNMGNSLTYDQAKEDPRFDHIKHVLVKDGKIQPDKNSFLPRFSLEGTVVGKNKQYEKVVYRDVVNPRILRLIQQREDPSLMLLDTFGMNSTDIPEVKSPTDDGVWGVAIWENVNPRIDYVSVYVTGLTNAHQVVHKPDGSISFKRRTLQLNFWRPGDQVYEVTDDIDFGIPLVDNHRKQIEICRRYNLPGPVIQGFVVSPTAHQNVLVAECDAEISLDTLKTDLIPELDSGKLPTAVTESFAASGVSIPNDVAVKTEIAGLKWNFDANGLTYVLQLEPQFWEPKVNGGIRFIKSLDYLWIYR